MVLYRELLSKAIALLFGRSAQANAAAAESRSQERLRRVALTAIASGAAQIITMLTALISVPLTLRYLGNERYGLWVALTSLISLFSFADLGLGNGLLNAIAEANGKDDRQMAREYVSSASLLLLGIALLLTVTWLIVYPRVSWAWLFNLTSPQALAEVGPAMSALVFCFVVSIPLGVVEKIQIGYQEGYNNNLWRAGGSLVGLAAVLAAIAFGAGLPWLVLSMAGAPIVATLANGWRLFHARRAWLRPALRTVRRAAMNRILHLGVLFFVLQLAVALGFQSDNVVVARFLGADQVSQYAVPLKLFMLAPSLVGLLVAPLWPAYGEAIARRDTIWVRRIFRRSLLVVGGLNALPALLLVIFGNEVLHLWAGPGISTTLSFRIGLGLWAMLYGVANAIAVLLNGAGVVGFQVVTALLMAVANLAISIALVQRIGVAGPVYGSLIAMVLFSVVPLAFYLPRVFADWRDQSHPTPAEAARGEA